MAIIYTNRCCNCGNPVFASKACLSDKPTYPGTDWEIDINLCMHCYMNAYDLTVDDRYAPHAVPSGTGSDVLIEFLSKRIGILNFENRKQCVALAKARMMWWNDSFDNCYYYWSYSESEKEYDEYREQWLRIIDHAKKHYERISSEKETSHVCTL